MEKNLKTLVKVAIAAAFVGAILATLLLTSLTESTQTMDYGVFLRAIDQDMVYSVELTKGGTSCKVKLKGVTEEGEGATYRVVTYGTDTMDFAIKRAQGNSVKIIEHESETGLFGTSLVRVCMYLAIAWVIAMIVYEYFNYKNKKSKNKGEPATSTFTSKGEQTYTEDIEQSDVKFSDVAGLDEEIVELSEIAGFLKNPEKYTKLGAKVPKGVLLYGKPGTGKTLLAKAIAGEAGVNFVGATGSGFINKYVGVGADNVRKLFNNARNKAPCIVFIDEIDAIGGKREEDNNSERKQTIDELLTQMDGFKARNDIIILAATNNYEGLDPALVRPGRFDRTIYIGLPDVRGREGILKVHSRNKPLMDDVRLPDVAKRTAGFSGADLENLLNEAAILAARNNQEAITNDNLDEAYKKVTVGLAKANRVISEKEKTLVAIHEAGHAVVSMFMSSQPKVKEVTIIPHGRAGGYTMHDTDEDKGYTSKAEFNERLAVLIAGYAAEKLFLRDVSTGAYNDIEVATKIVKDMVCIYGMSESLGPVSIKATDNGELQLLSDDKLNEAGDEIVKLMKQAEERATTIISKKRAMHGELVQMLLEKESVSGDELLELYNKHVLAANAK